MTVLNQFKISIINWARANIKPIDEPFFEYVKTLNFDNQAKCLEQICNKFCDKELILIHLFREICTTEEQLRDQETIIFHINKFYRLLKAKHNFLFLGETYITINNREELIDKVKFYSTAVLVEIFKRFSGEEHKQIQDFSQYVYSKLQDLYC
jgi:hypothetical protein